MKWVEVLEANRLVLAAFAFFVTWMILAGAKRRIKIRLLRWAKSTERAWDDAIVEALGAPLKILVFVFSMYVATRIGLNGREIPALGVAFKTLLLICAVWVLERTITVLLRSEVVRFASNVATRDLLLTLARVLVVSVGLLMILDNVGVSITPVLASLGIGSVAIALALQDTLSNFFSGIYILMDQPIRVGDFVKTESDVEGYVKKIGWRTTHIQLLSNNMVLIPNSRIATSRLTNYDLPERETAVLVQLGVSYDSDLQKVEQVTEEVGKEVLNRVDGGIRTFQPFIRYHTLGESSIDFTVILRARHFTDHYLIKHEFIKELIKRYRQEGISIPFPQRTLHISSMPDPGRGAHSV